MTGSPSFMSDFRHEYKLIALLCVSHAKIKGGEISMTKKESVKRGSIIGLALLTTALFSSSLFLSAQADGKTYYKIDTSATMQTMDGWGTSLCWWADAVGGWDMEGVSGKTKREEIVDLVFGKDGLNLNIARYNIPGGDDPSHSHMLDHRGMSLVKASADSEYEWENDANQMWILQAAYQLRESDLFVETFNNSAPYWMTESGCSSGGESKSDANLPRENYGMFAEYYADYVNYIENELGVPVSSVEVMNEPGSDYWGANGSQEGCKVPQGEAQSELIKAVYQEMSEREILDDKIFAAPDETNPGLAYDSFTKLDEEAKEIISKLNYHIYSKSTADRQKMRSAAYGTGSYDDPDYKLWQSEITYGVSEGEDDANNHNTLTNVFDLAQDIHDDLYYANVNAWIIWQAVETELNNMQYGNNYGLIHGVYQDWDNSEYGFDMEHMALNRGDYFITKQYYAMGQYSRYIKEGYKIVESPDSNCVVAVSPDYDELVIVYANSSEEDKDLSLYLKGFAGESARKIVTDGNVNWAESAQAVSGEYIDFTAGAESITTVVIQGYPVSESSDEATYFENFIHRSSTLFAQFHLEDTTAEYTFYWANTEDKLPVNGGEGAQSRKLNGVSKNCSLTIEDQTGDVYYGVLERKKGEKIYYSRVLKTTQTDTENAFTYLTLAGRMDKLSLDGTGYSFGEYYGVADQAFGTDPFTGKQWGYTGTAAETGEYNSNELLGSARYANTDTLTYRYEVEQGVKYSLMLAFLDPWGSATRSMELSVNGENTGMTITGTNELSMLYVEDVEGVLESNSCFITVTLRKTAGTSENPAVNLIAIQTAEQETEVFGVLPIDGVTLEQGELLSSVMPEEITLLTSRGERPTKDFTIDSVDYSDGLKQGGGSIVVRGLAEGRYPFEFTVVTQDKGEQIYYYIDAGALAPNDSLLVDFEILKSANPTLINTDAIDKYAEDENDWGRLNGSEYWTGYWENDYTAMESIVEGKFKTGTGAEGKTHIQYRITDLPAGKYTVVVGVDVKTWGSKNRTVTFAMGEEILGTQSGYSGVNEWSYVYNKKDDGPVVFDAYTSGLLRENPVLSYVIIKTTAGNEERALTPSLPTGISQSQTEITVRNIDDAGTLLILTDDTGKLIAEHIVTSAESKAGRVLLAGLDLSGSTTLSAQQYKEGSLASAVAETQVVSLGVSAPRIEWSAEADVITVSPSGNNIASIAYRYETGEWMEIKQKKFFRAERNGTYYIRLITTENVQIVEAIEVTCVDTVEMKVTNDLTAWTDEDMILSLDFSSSPLAMKSVTVSDGVNSVDVTSTGNGGVYTYTVKQNGTYIVTAVSELGTEKSFVVEVTTIDKAEAAIDYALSLEDGVLSVEFSTQSLGDVKFYYNVDGGEFRELYQAKVPLFREGVYIYKMTNMLGKEASVKIEYATSLANGPVTASINGNKYTFTFADGLTNIRVARLDGTGGYVELDGNTVQLTEGGQYAVVAEQADGAVYIASFFVSAQSAGDSQNDGCGSVVHTTWGTSAVVLCLLGTLIVVWRKKHD